MVFGVAEYATSLLFILMVPIVLAPRGISKALGMAVIGLLVGLFWGEDISSGVAREFFGLNIDGEVPLIALIAVFGFLLPRIVAYAQQAESSPPIAWVPLIYESVFLYEAAPAMLAMRQPWLPHRWVLPLAVLWSAALCVYYEFTPTDTLFGIVIFGLGLLLQQLDCPWTPAILGIAVSPMLEQNLRRSLLLSKGDWSTFVVRPISASLLAATCLLLIVSIAIRWRSRIRARRRP